MGSVDIRDIGVWQPTTTDDLRVVDEIADEIHPLLPEEPEVFAEKFNLFPEGCFVFLQRSNILGYGFSHPWLLGSIPELNTFLGKLPERPSCLFIHDVALLEGGRGHHASGAFVDIVARVAKRRGIASLALVSVYDTGPVWKSYGFEAMTLDQTMSEKVLSYGTDAQYMIRKLG